MCGFHATATLRDEYGVTGDVHTARNRRERLPHRAKLSLEWHCYVSNRCCRGRRRRPREQDRQRFEVAGGPGCVASVVELSLADQVPRQTADRLREQLAEQLSLGAAVALAEWSRVVDVVVLVGQLRRQHMPVDAAKLTILRDLLGNVRDWAHAPAGQ